MCGRYSQIMSNLVPELRADKDGKLVTRHVRVVTNDASTVAIPAPVVSATPPNEVG